MLYFDGALGVLLFGLWVFCLVDVVVTDESACRNLPKIVWLLLVVLLLDVGAVIWLLAGRPRRTGYQYSSSPFPEYDRPGRHVASSPEDDAEFLRRCRERAEEQRRRAKEL